MLTLPSVLKVPEYLPSACMFHIKKIERRLKLNKMRAFLIKKIIYLAFDSLLLPRVCRFDGTWEEALFLHLAICYCFSKQKRSQSPFPRQMAHRAAPISVSIAPGHAS